ncbi:putative l-ascorbic acid binding protein [Daldinia childiae]|uniref:putative l-ascorbic acid binding protein n=1 Tax=Daldinia childiae TaxID=326645 RepID=UPI001448A0D8|nr:putative l-ascorbic acid binding protein [Daldinia childiae]KAF3063646.1 putative l-ascorbic acid binding protein [Daldinia childiae]
MALYNASNEIDSKAKKLALFEGAMRKVYGPYPTDTHNPTSWKPPAKPGAGGHHGRYLWTDAFGVINFITLSHEKGGIHSQKLYLELARRLADKVHSVLGRTRDGTSRLRGATDEQPLKGGLRIGKLNAEGPDGDGQYHHYLTLWMFALNRLALATEEPHWNDLAVQLAKAIHPYFMTERGGQESMVWKISTDMLRVLVNSKGNLDDVDGLVVYQLLQETAEHFNKSNTTDSLSSSTLDTEIEHYRRIMADHPKSLSGDPLDLGMSLWISHFDKEAAWSSELSKQGLTIARNRFLPAAQSPVSADKKHSYRLAFREFGGCLGIKCYVDDPAQPLHMAAEAVLDAWEGKVLNAADEDLRPINLVMYAAALIPGGEPSLSNSLFFPFF